MTIKSICNDCREGNKDLEIYSAAALRGTPCDICKKSIKHGVLVPDDTFIKIGARNNRMDKQTIQAMHDASVQLGAACDADGKSIETDELVYFGDAVKVLGDGKLGGYLVRHSGTTDPDLTTDFFDTKSDITAPDNLPVLYQHGFDPTIGKKILGSAKTGRDEVGLWIEAQLNMRDEYEKAVYELAKAGKLGWSSGALSHLVEREPKGKATRIKTWFIGEASLTPTPAEYRNAVIPIKSLAFTTEAAASDKADVTIESNQQEINTMNEEEKNALLAEVKSVFAEVQDAQADKIKAIAKDAAREVIAELPEVKTAMNIQVTHDEADTPFKSIAENMLAIRSNTLKGDVYGDSNFPRLRYIKATGASEGVPQDGGLLLDPTLAAEILKPIHEVAPFSSQINWLEVGANSNYGWVNGVDETSRVTGSRWGGIRGYRLAEGATKTASKPTFRRIQWELKKYAAVVVSTDELLADASQFSQIVRQGVTEEMMFMLNEDIFDGSGIAGPQGFMNSGALITVTRDSASSILGTDISAMYYRMDLRGRNTANWYISNDARPQLDKLFAVGSTAVLFPYASIGIDGVARLYGRPIYTTEFNAALNTTGDIAFCDMTQYLGWEKGEVEESTSIHVYYLADETAFRFVYRCDGKSSVNTALTPLKGSTTTSPFVVLTSAT